MHLVQPDAVTAIPYQNEPQVVANLTAELPSYLALAADTIPNLVPRDWWKRNATSLPKWSETAKKIVLLQPSSAAAERVFSLLNNSFGPQHRIIHNVTVQ